MAIERFRGDTDPIVINLKYKSTGLPFDATGCTYLLTVDSLKDPPDTATRQFQLSGIIQGLPTAGIIAFTPTVSNVDLVGDFFFDIQQTNSVGSVKTIKKDKIKFLQDITK